MKARIFAQRIPNGIDLERRDGQVLHSSFVGAVYAAEWKLSPCPMALNPLERKVLNTAFGMSSAANEPLNPDAVRSNLRGINEEDFYVSLEIMEGDGLIETSRKFARRPSNFWVTSRGIVRLLDEKGQRPAIQLAVEKAIVAKPNSTLSEIAGAVAQPPLIVAAIVETLEDWGEIDVRRGLGLEPQVSGVHAALRRRVQEAGQ